MAAQYYYPLGDCRGTIIAFHGGCFTGGNSTWDTDQNELLESMGFAVAQVVFPKTAVAFERWVDAFDASSLTKPLYCLGRSSGGYLAKIFSRRWNIARTLYIAPVFMPLLRGALKPEFNARTETFFGETLPHNTTEWSCERELLLLAHDDERVPRELFTEQQLAAAVYVGPRTHSGLLKTTSERFADIVDRFFL